MNPINTGALGFALGDIRGRRGGGQVEFVVLARVGDHGPHAILRDLIYCSPNSSCRSDDERGKVAVGQ